MDPHTSLGVSAGRLEVGAPKKVSDPEEDEDHERDDQSHEPDHHDE
jgi:hypothetical protein